MKGWHATDRRVFSPARFAILVICCLAAVQSPARGDGPADGGATPSLSSSPPSSTPSLQPRVAALKGKSGTEVESLLSELGFGPQDRARATGAVSNAACVSANLDADPEQETIVRVEVAVAPPDQRTDSHLSLVNFIAVLNPAQGGVIVAGTRVVEVGSCVMEAGVSVGAQKVHSGQFDDIVVSASSAPTCDGANLAFGERTLVMTVERGSLQDLLDYEDWGYANRLTPQESKAPKRVTFTGAQPKQVQLKDGARVVQTLRWSAKDFKYPLPPKAR